MLGIILIVGASTAHASDVWSDVATGVRWLHRTTTGETPQDIHVVEVDLQAPGVSIQASSSETGTQRGVSTSTFAQSIGAVAAINGDWSYDTQTPIGLAISNGSQWSEHFNDTDIGGAWGYFACDAFSRCEAEVLEPLSTAWWFASPYPTLSPYRYFNAVGGNGVMLIDDGARQSGCYDGCDGDVCRHPRSAICVTEDRDTLFLMVVDGRSASASGMTCDEVRDLAEELGCWDALMLDGGGSSTMWVDGSVANSPSDSSERSLPNHIGVMVKESPDSECEVQSGRWCDDTTIATCSGGRFIGDGDCAYYGATCQEDEDWAFCVDYRCPDGDGNKMACQSEDEIQGCVDGIYSEGDCSSFGMTCGEDSQGGSCMDTRCEAGPHSSFCLDDQTIGSCSEGLYEALQCAADETCVAAGESATCQGPEDTDTTPADTANPDTDTDGEDSDTSDNGSDGDSQQGPVSPEPETTEAGCSGCAAAGPLQGAWAVAGIVLLSMRRRRTPQLGCGSSQVRDEALVG